MMKEAESKKEYVRIEIPSERFRLHQPYNIKKYDEEFDPGSGWTLAAGLTHASRGV